LLLCPCVRKSIATSLARHQTYTHEHFEDMPEVRDWVWTDM